MRYLTIFWVLGATLLAQDPENELNPGLAGGRAQATNKNSEAPLVGKKESAYDDPRVQRGIRMQAETQVNSIYGDLLERKDFISRAILRSLLTERLIVASTHEGRMAESRDQRDALAKVFEIERKKSNETLRQQFGDATVAEVAYLEGSDSERQHVNAFKKVLARAGMELAPKTQAELKRAMYEERMNSDFKNSTLEDLMVLNNFDEETVAQLEDHFARLHDRINKRAKPLLEPAAFAIFREVISKRNLLSLRLLKNAHGKVPRTPNK